MDIKDIEFENFKKMLTEHEEWLMKRILDYAKEHDFTKYTSTLKEAWRVSIEGLSSSLIQLMDIYKDPPELNPDEDYSKDPASKFGLIEAQKHRSRGVSLSMFLGLFKYYRQAYHDLFKKEAANYTKHELFTTYIDRFFDRMEIAYCSEWAGLSSERQILDLSRNNLGITNEKNKYLTVFDSFGSPAILLDKEGYVENYNLIALKIFKNRSISGKKYYSQEIEKERFHWIDEEISQFLSSEDESMNFQKTYDNTCQIFNIKITRLNDISNKFTGCVIVMDDSTNIIKAQERLKITKDKQIEQEQILIQQSKLAAMGEMINMIAHQWRQPIAVVSMAANNIKIDASLDICEKEEMESIADDILEQTSYLSQTIEDFSNFFKPNKEKISSNIEDVIEESLKMIGSSLDNNNIMLEKRFKKTRNIITYPRELLQVFINIIKNSKEAFEEKRDFNKKITIELYEDGNNIIVDIIDNAGGIPKDIIDSIFDPYFSTKFEKNGTGIGLYMSDTIIEKHLHGKLLAQNVKNGAKFTIVLPTDRFSDDS